MTPAPPGAAAPPRTSVIVVSRGRPALLLRCLAGLAQSDHPEFEVIVVADAAGRAAVAGSPAAAEIKLAACDTANIALARNIGLALAAAPVVAFIDDDAVPEPTWLSRLAAPFADRQVDAAGGFVRGRNGFSWQWRARWIDRDGREGALEVPGDRVSLHPGTSARAVRTEGTNCAFRRDVLAGIGGFDPAYAFFLDESDVNLRLALAGHVTAIVPGAEVHHGFAASERRRADRAPRNLHDIGRSTAAFLRRHGGDAAGGLARLRAEQRARLLRYMVAGLILPGEVSRLMATLETGIAEGRDLPLPRLAPLPATEPPFRRLPGTGCRPGQVFAGRPAARPALIAAAAEAAAAGSIVTVICLSPTLRRHRMWFDGARRVWVQAGGIWGRSERTGPRPRPGTFAARIGAESTRLAARRPVAAGSQSCILAGPYEIAVKP